ncbi:hypothetical protein RHGRI_022518 [Rhododendron griersonianum]|uniref:U6 snRNA-associated Sm-like protein LSm8 n=1 Tax=Rhododendron griersonianum TaxID=479676 RepID=A0AAV6J3B6_9ERIC|nr:hypothetical protein RHGRI_022518 [Rhododendron griersonianum]
MAGIEHLVLEGYGYVVLTLVFYCFFNFWMAFQVGKARKKHFEFRIVCAVKHQLVVPNRSSQNVKWDWARKSKTISVITNDGRNIVGVLKGFDQATNIILDESHERVYSTKEGVQQLVLGLYIIRGDNISIVGEIDEELDAGLDLSKLRAHPLKPVIH